MKTALVLGGGGFIGGHLAKRLKDEGFWVRVVDIKQHPEFFNENDICDEYICGDLRDPNVVSKVLFGKNQTSKDDKINSFDEVYQLAADMGGAGYVFSGENDANIMHNSALINLNVVYYSAQFNVKKIFYSSSACIYPKFNQIDPNNPICTEESAYPAFPDSEYGWEKLFSERLFLAWNRNYGLKVRVARFHNIFGINGTWDGGKEKAPAAMCRKVAKANDGDTIEIWGSGNQTRSFLYIDECIEAVLKYMRADIDFDGVINIGSEEMISINNLAKMVIDISGKNISIHNISAEEFKKKYGKELPLGVNGRNSDNKLIESLLKWKPSKPLKDGIEKTFHWINKQVKSQL